MAGHRIRAGKPTRAAARTERSTARLDSRLAIAATPEQRASAAFDALRSAASRSPGRGPQALEQAARELASLARWVTDSDERQ